MALGKAGPTDATESRKMTHIGSEDPVSWKFILE